MSFDTIGVLFRDLRDGPVLAEALFGVQVKSGTGAVRIGFVGDEFLEDCEPAVLDAFADRKLDLTRARASLDQFDAGFWADSMEIFAPIQASEAAALHRGFYEHFEPAIAERLAWGASIGAEELGVLRTRLRLFRVRMSELFERFDFLLVPCAPVSRLVAGEDQSGARKRILRYTTPMSLGGNPVVTLPGEQIGSALGTGMQLVGEVGRDAELLAFAAGLGAASR
jgi:aspartyl-tRNA(Asn)/glutamyl-tRNA(Gln) amidotransferase subunit A